MRSWVVLDPGRCLTLYAGHTGSVNGIAFHPTQDLVLTCSGDATGHVWQASEETHACTPSTIQTTLNGRTWSENVTRYIGRIFLCWKVKPKKRQFSKTTQYFANFNFFFSKTFHTLDFAIKLVQTEIFLQQILVISIDTVLGKNLQAEIASKFWIQNR